MIFDQENAQRTRWSLLPRRGWWFLRTVSYDRLDRLQPDEKFRAFVLALAGRSNGTAVPFHNRAANCEAKPEPAEESGACAISLLKGVIDAWHGFGADPNPIVADFNHQLRARL